MSTASRRAGRVGRTLKPANKSKSHNNFITTPPLARNGLRQYQKEAAATVIPLPLAMSLKKALVFSAAEEFIPREHARRLLALLQLQEV